MKSILPSALLVVGIYWLGEAQGPTQVSISSLRGLKSPQPMVLVSLPSGGFVQAQVAGGGLTQVGGVYTLTLPAGPAGAQGSQGAPGTPQPLRTDAFTVNCAGAVNCAQGVPVQSFTATMPGHGEVQAYRNGLLMTLGTDYTLAAGGQGQAVVTFTAQTVADGDNILITYR